MTADTIVIHDDELYREPVEEVDARCNGWWDDLRGGRPDTLIPRTTIWNVAGQAFVVLRNTGLVVVHYSPGPDELEMTIVVTRVPVASRERFDGADVVVSWPFGHSSLAATLDAEHDPETVSGAFDMSLYEAVPIAEFLTTLGACSRAFIYAGSLDAMPG